MGSGPAFFKDDGDKTRDELAEELERSRGDVARLKKIIAGQQKVLEVRKALQAKSDELEVRLECAGAYEEELLENQRQLETFNEELEAQAQELRVNNEELLTMMEALRESEFHLNRAQEIAHLGSWSWGIAENRSCWSDEIYRLFGLEPGKFVPRYDDLLGFVHASDRERVEKSVQDALIHGTCNVDFRIIRKGGEERWAHGEGSTTFDARGNPVKMEGTVQDITEHRRAEEARKLTQFALDNFGESAIWVTKDGRMVYANQAACRSLGYSREELLSMHIWDIDPNYPQEDLLEFWSVRMRDHHTKFESVHVARDGRAFPVEITSSCIRYGDEEYLITFDRDIAERRRAEEALAGAREQLAAELAAMDRLHAISMQNVLDGNLPIVLDGIIGAAVSITNADVGNIQILDPEAGRLKIVAQRGFGQPFLEHFDSVARGMGSCGEAMARMERVVVEDIGQGTIFSGADLEAMRAAGIRAVQSTPLMSRDGRLLGMFSTHYRRPYRPGERELKLIDLLARQTADIVERTLAEKQLVDSKAQAELYLDLMGHDINNMHQVALGYLELARDLPRGADQSALLEKPVEVLQRCAQLIGNVRKLQKLHDGVFQTQDIDVCRVLADVQQEYGAVPNKPVTLNVNGQGSCCVRANELLHDVFANLVSNAIKHTGDRADIVIDLDVIKVNGARYCRVSVEDNGRGIPDEFKAAIFNRTLKGTKNAKGMGLGLYLVKSLVDSYGGRVWAEDRVAGDHAQGARFVVMLPVVEE